MSADAAFERVADAAAAAFAAAPALVRCRVSSRLASEGRTDDRTQRVVYHTRERRADAYADDGSPLAGGMQLLPPVVDALASWAFRFVPRGGGVRMEVAYERPKSYAPPTPGAGVDVVVASVSGYAVAYAGPDHVRLEPATASVREFASLPDHFTYRDVWYDPATWLPTRVVVASPDETLALDYSVVAGHWVLAHLAYDGLAREPRLRRYRVDATYAVLGFDAAVRAVPGGTGAAPRTTATSS